MDKSIDETKVTMTFLLAAALMVADTLYSGLAKAHVPRRDAAENAKSQAEALMKLFPSLSGNLK